MHETAEDLAELQHALDDSYAHAGVHLRSIFVPSQRSSAEDLAASLSGVFMINLATVTARGEPLVAPVDGLFYRARLWFSLPPGSLRARHLHARPQVSATYVEGDQGPCVIVHGVAERVHEGHPLFEGFDRYARELYGIAVDVAKLAHEEHRDPEFTGFIVPRRIYAQAFPKAVDR
jgi:hypothetical protein